MTEYYAGQKLQKIADNRIVRINFVGEKYIRLEGDIEPNLVVLKDKIKQRYTEVVK